MAKKDQCKDCKYFELPQGPQCADKTGICHYLPRAEKKLISDWCSKLKNGGKR